MYYFLTIRLPPKNMKFKYLDCCDKFAINIEHRQITAEYKILSNVSGKIPIFGVAGKRGVNNSEIK